MNNEVNVVGMTFVNKDPAFKTLRPEGRVSLIPDPDNKFDKNAVQVWGSGEEMTRIGFLPAKDGGDILQREVIDIHSKGETVYAYVLGYAYYADKSFNNNHKGRLQACTLFVADSEEAMDEGIKAYNARVDAKKASELGLEEDTGADEVTSTHYITDGVKYRRLTDLLGIYEPDGKDGADRIIKWACDQGSFDDYKTRLNTAASDGTKMHNEIERWLNGNENADVPQGFLNWWDKYQPEIIDVETTVYDEGIKVAGTFDLLCRINDKGKDLLVAVDWKSSKAVRKKHRLQVGWYASQANADEGWVVCFGGTQKQGYGLSKVDKDVCGKKAEQVDLLVQLQELE